MRRSTMMITAKNAIQNAMTIARGIPAASTANEQLRAVRRGRRGATGHVAPARDLGHALVTTQIRELQADQEVIRAEHEAKRRVDDARRDPLIPTMQGGGRHRRVGNALSGTR
jgi:hypothetical protein